MPGRAQHWEAAKGIKMEDELLLNAEQKKGRTPSMGGPTACDAYVTVPHVHP